MKMLLQTLWPLVNHREIVVHRFPFVIGRRSDSDFSLPLAFVSRQHCQFTRTGNQVLVQDLESYNGTFVNGKRAINPLPVRNGDELTLGPCSFRVSVMHDTGETPALLSGVGTAEAPAARPSRADDEWTVNSQGDSFLQPRPSDHEK
jgi:pSer/pThr/pTyr-binding forkhead associated (FHA) protein